MMIPRKWLVRAMSAFAPVGFTTLLLCSVFLPPRAEAQANPASTNPTSPVFAELGNEVQAISAGGIHTCALTSVGAVWCWGNNDSGQLGDGTWTNRPTPTAVSGLSGNVRAISAGYSHTCALTSAGTVWCWGYNGYGQLGDDATTYQSAPVAVSGLPNDVQAISSGYDHTCALTGTGSVWCWGRNSDGQLGDGTTVDSRMPVSVSSLPNGVQAISAGGWQTCALTNASTVWCWGDNFYGQLGDGTTMNRTTPVAVVGLPSGVQAINAGREHTCALTNASAVRCWGKNSYGQIGDGTGTHRLTPVAVSGLSSGVQAISAGREHTCASTNAGMTWCWGQNEYGQLGDGTQWTNRLTPVPVLGLSSDVQAISAGESHTCAIAHAGTVWCWGYNGYGQLGDGTTTSRLTPVVVWKLSSGIQAISTGYQHTCALTSDEAVLCWGTNTYGQLGDGTTTSRLRPVSVYGLPSHIQAISAGSFHTCALTDTGAVWCWGDNGYGQLGDGTTTNRPTPVALSDLSSGVRAISTGWAHTCALTDDGAVRCWGNNESGQLGDGTTTNRWAPVTVSASLTGVQAISTGDFHTCASTNAGTMWCWGDNFHGQLGDGTMVGRLTPVTVTGLPSNTQTISVGGSHTCASMSTGAMWCWGRNSYGQLGDGTTTDRAIPVAVSGLPGNVQGIETGTEHTCALTSNGTMWCWGGNFYGQLGDGTAMDSRTPVSVSGLPNGVQAVGAGNFHSCALTSTSAVWCWGWNSNGQIGDDTTTNRLTPVLVIDLPWSIDILFRNGFE